MRPLLRTAGPIVLGLALLAPAPAQAQQSVTFLVGGFAPLRADDRGEGRFSDEVLVRNLDFLDFRIRHLDGGLVGVEYLAAAGDFFDFGIGASYYSQTAPSRYRGFVEDNGREIEQRLRLRIAPFTATVRFLPLGHRDAIKPYFGGGVGIFAWRYTESGDFIRADSSIFRDTFVGTGTAVGPVMLGGLQIPMNGWDLGGEVRYQQASGDLPSNQSFAGSTIDLSGWTGLVTFNIHF